MEQYQDVTYDPHKTSERETSRTLSATVPNWRSGPGRGDRWHMCPTCGCGFPESKMVRRKGAWYCKEDGEDWLESDARRERR